MSLGANDCILISNPAKDFYEDLGALFTALEPGDEKGMQLHNGRYAHKPDTSSKRTQWKFLNSLDVGIGARKKARMTSEGIAGFDGIIVGWGAIKSEDHG